MKACEVCGGAVSAVYNGTMAELVCVSGCGSVQRNLECEELAELQEVSTDHKVSDCVKVLTSHINAERAITRQGKKIYNMAYYNAKHKEILQQKKKYRGREEVRASDRNRKADEYEIERASVEMSEAAGFGVYGVFGFEFLNGIVEVEMRLRRAHATSAAICVPTLFLEILFPHCGHK